MTEGLTAYCGLACSECPAYIAHRTDDQALRAKTATEWGSEEFPVSADDVNCDGCLTADGVRWTWCQQCTVRTCASERGAVTCAVCPDYGCDVLEAFLEMAGEEARQRLAALRTTALDESTS